MALRVVPARCNLEASAVMRGLSPGRVLQARCSLVRGGGRLTLSLQEARDQRDSVRLAVVWPVGSAIREAVSYSVVGVGLDLVASAWSMLGGQPLTCGQENSWVTCGQMIGCSPRLGLPRSIVSWEFLLNAPSSLKWSSAVQGIHEGEA
jgi:hypothetical protein